ncbi:MAG: CapA family protein [Alistipes sp.]|nr:CapA family protein [Alistipes senegalensis]MCM1250429.1 CapA family protein [Alistipes sp.]
MGCGRTPVPASEPTTPAPVTVKLLFSGDVMQHLPQVDAARRAEGFDYAATFAAVKPRFRAADLAVVNLETTLTRSSRYTGYPMFRSPAALADALADAGVDVATLANNHCCDGGCTGIRTTVGELDRCGIRHTGAFADSLDRAARHPLFVACRGVRFAFLNYTYGTNGLPVPDGTLVNLIDTLRMAGDLAAVSRDSVDCVVVCMHWGNEYERLPNASQRRLAGFLRRHGADLIVGHHPHVVQPYEADSTHVVLYSLGNFVSNQRRRYRDGGLMAEIDATRHPDGRMTYALRLVPVWVSMPGYRVLPPEAADTMSLPEAYRRFREDCDALLETVL